MLRRLLTCLALITGLAATGMPASAAVSSMLDSEIGASLAEQVSDQESECPCSQGEIAGSFGKPAKNDCKPLRAVTIYIPTVQLQADRAYE